MRRRGSQGNWGGGRVVGVGFGGNKGEGGGVRGKKKRVEKIIKKLNQSISSAGK